MKTSLAFVLGCFLAPFAAHAAAPHPSVEYSVQTPKWPFSELRAKVNGREQVVVPASSKRCLRSVETRDFDGDGVADLLVMDAPACGGNAVPEELFFVSLRKGRLVESRLIPYGNVEPWRGGWSVLTTENRAGYGRMPEVVVQRWVLRSGAAVCVETRRTPTLKSQRELRSEQVLAAKARSSSLSFDLDGDGLPDTLSVDLWERWGSLVWSVKFGSGTSFESHVGCYRIGVLDTSTQGVRDLVCDQATVFRWNGHGYSDESE